ncbi:uncharacterized protein TRIADDRAFT_55347 [Trichoplax adhaerens]|uniref:Uncharacterized protein n=1 Tax=Trichoplax adhaerens TaxID=10228 RepID=B3RUM7_TRIAD|nr:hypothetical protein TRIADDRAFT_55347 [Trichoplax adhaerens]EDV25353.1 hypothetical protein TRIADDRAFT_55347 [Trichoplax adhaerens]|eukprot:XP_002111386.1 hypothetical protein TRIADDRAFT_55347 [Trichoplax adhaerens]
MVNSLRECAENTDRSEFIKEFHLEDMCTSELVNSAREYEEILSKLKTKCLESKYCIYDNGNYFINASHFIKDSGLLEDGIFKNVELIKVMSCDQVEPILLAVTSLELAVQEESNSDIITTVNVVPHNKLFYATKMSLLWQILSNKSNAAAIKHQVSVAIERVITVGDINLTLASDLIRLRKAQMKRASILKYGSTVHDPSWQGIIAEVASTTIKFEMLGTSGNEPNTYLGFSEICQFMTMLCRTFSSYYRSIRILTAPLVSRNNCNLRKIPIHI